MKLEDPRLFRHFAWINGEWSHSLSGREQPVYNPDDVTHGYQPVSSLSIFRSERSKTQA